MSKRKRQENARLYEQGMRHQLAVRNPKIVPRPEWSGPDYFARGRVVGRDMIRGGYDRCTDPEQIAQAQEIAREAFEQAYDAASRYHVAGNTVTKKTFDQMELEPCATCDLILYCRDNEMTCSAFRAFVSNVAGKVNSIRVRVPDKRWDESFPWDKE